MCLEFTDDFPMETHLGSGAYSRLCAVPFGKSGALLHAKGRIAKALSDSLYYSVTARNEVAIIKQARPSVTDVRRCRRRSTAVR